MTDRQLQQYRTTVDELVQRAKRDPAFAQRARADPVGTLMAAGVPADVANRLMSDAAAENEVAGYARLPCGDFTCFVTHYF